MLAVTLTAIGLQWTIGDFVKHDYIGARNESSSPGEDDADAAEGGDAKRAKGEGVEGGKGVDPAAGTPQGSAASAPATVQFSIFDDDSEDDS